MRSKRKPSLCPQRHKDGVAISRLAALGRISRVSPHLLSLERIWYYIKLSENVKENFSGNPISRESYTNLAVFILTPGPMVEAATQLRIYWPLAVAGFAFTMAPIRAL